jgi:hypothetical protein
MSEFATQRAVAIVADLLSQSISRACDRLENNCSGDPTEQIGEGGSWSGINLSKKSETDPVLSIADKRVFSGFSTGMGAQSPESGWWNSQRQ